MVFADYSGQGGLTSTGNIREGVTRRSSLIQGTPVETLALNFKFLCTTCPQDLDLSDDDVTVFLRKRQFCVVAWCQILTKQPQFFNSFSIFASHQCGPGSNPDIWVEFYVGFLSCSERFFSGYSGFPFSSKTNTCKFQFQLERTDTFERVLKNF